MSTVIRWYGQSAFLVEGVCFSVCGLRLCQLGDLWQAAERH